mmetsp:Transcript_18552/g.54508  ORF Transcript_18552/g.54508 Transcript_18552/m.54508 type:complete len:229 (+) Transcript_18552:2249-2935(+)
MSTPVLPRERPGLLYDRTGGAAASREHERCSELREAALRAPPERLSSKASAGKQRRACSLFALPRSARGDSCSASASADARLCPPAECRSGKRVSHCLDTRRKGSTSPTSSPRSTRRGGAAARPSDAQLAHAMASLLRLAHRLRVGAEALAGPAAQGRASLEALLAAAAELSEAVEALRRCGDGRGRPCPALVLVAADSAAEAAVGSVAGAAAGAAWARRGGEGATRP